MCMCVCAAAGVGSFDRVAYPQEVRPLACPLAPGGVEIAADLALALPDAVLPPERSLGLQLLLAALVQRLDKVPEIRLAVLARDSPEPCVIVWQYCGFKLRGDRT